MPYVKQERRLQIERNGVPGTNDILTQLGKNIENAGDLNYTLSRICIEYIKNHGTRYQYMNDVMGALEGCKLELYRRLIGPYEDKAIEKNGDLKF